MALSEEFYVSARGEQKGPYSFLQLRRMSEKGFVAEDALYWRDGMEQWQPFTELCGPSLERRRKMGRRVRTVVTVCCAFLVAVAVVLGPPAWDAWREINQHEFTAESAYWKARGYIRTELHQQNATVTFDSLSAAHSKAEPPARFAVDLPATIFRRVARTRALWHVVLEFDPAQREWRLLAKHATEPAP